jgi:flagellar hook-basal body complex protein FliE
MDLTPVRLTSLGSTPVQPAPTGAGKAVGGFGDALTDAVQTLDKLQKEPDQLGTQLAAGDPVELHDVMLAQERATLSFQLAVQVRTKLVEAYQDIMRMQV